MLEFTSEIKNPGVCGKAPKQFLSEDGDYSCEIAIIEWTLDFEMREYGIKDTYITIKKVTLIFDDFDYAELDELAIVNTIDDWEFISKWYDRDDFKWLTIFPVEIWVDFDNKKVEVEF